jgi:hypothetical protein
LLFSATQRGRRLLGVLFGDGDFPQAMSELRGKMLAGRLVYRKGFRESVMGGMARHL